MVVRRRRAELLARSGNAAASSRPSRPVGEPAQGESASRSMSRVNGTSQRDTKPEEEASDGAGVWTPESASSSGAPPSMRENRVRLPASWSSVGHLLETAAGSPCAESALSPPLLVRTLPLHSFSAVPAFLFTHTSDELPSLEPCPRCSLVLPAPSLFPGPQCSDAASSSSAVPPSLSDALSSMSATVGTVHLMPPASTGSTVSSSSSSWSPVSKTVGIIMTLPRREPTLARRFPTPGAIRLVRCPSAMPRLPRRSPAAPAPRLGRRSPGPP
mmetsp:Transcript_35004/g.93712  ORF Transcript_35004/g.93712 Transcript_35004/m.93712 type:complete len:272 (+) Transcript_35004:798-1613(+)